MRRVDSEVVSVRSGEVEGVVDPAPGDLGGLKPFRRIIAARRLDIVDHQVEGRCGTGGWRLFDLPDNNVRAAAKLEDGKAVIGEDRAQADGLEPPLGSGDIGCREPDMANRYRRPLIDCLRHELTLR
jgi:hypothetical protein